MIKCEVIEEFTFGEFLKLKNIKRSSARNEIGRLYVKDTFECDKEIAKYLSGNNHKGIKVVKIIEVIPEV